MKKPTIRVLHYTYTWLHLTETWLFNQINFLPSYIENHIVCKNTLNLDQFASPNIHSLSDTKAWIYYLDMGLRVFHLRSYLRFVFQKARKHKTEILHSHYGNRGWANIGTARKARMKHIVTFYGLDVNYIHSLTNKWHDRYKDLFRTVDLVLCEGPHMAQSIMDQGCPAEKVKVHALGVDLGKLQFRPRKWDPGEPVRILITGSFREKKGIPFAVEAVGRLKKSIPVELTVIGDANNEKRSQREKHIILKVLQKYGLTKKTRMLGYQSHSTMLKEALNHHIFLSPSITASDGDAEGGAPVSIIEMSATGMPVVSTTHCDIPGVILHGETGLLAPERDVDALVRHLEWLIENNNSWRGMAVRAREHIEGKFNCRVQGERLAEIYRKVLKS